MSYTRNAQQWVSKNTASKKRRIDKKVFTAIEQRKLTPSLITDGVNLS